MENLTISLDVTLRQLKCVTIHLEDSINGYIYPEAKKFLKNFVEQLNNQIDNIEQS